MKKIPWDSVSNKTIIWKDESVGVYGESQKAYIETSKKVFETTSYIPVDAISYVVDSDGNKYGVKREKNNKVYLLPYEEYNIPELHQDINYNGLIKDFYEFEYKLSKLKAQDPGSKFISYYEKELLDVGTKILKLFIDVVSSNYEANIQEWEEDSGVIENAVEAKEMFENALGNLGEMRVAISEGLQWYHAGGSMLESLEIDEELLDNLTDGKYNKEWDKELRKISVKRPAEYGKAYWIKPDGEIINVNEHEEYAGKIANKWTLYIRAGREDFLKDWFIKQYTKNIKNKVYDEYYKNWKYNHEGESDDNVDDKKLYNEYFKEQWIKYKWEENSLATGKRLATQLLALDPTPTKQYAQWVMKLFLNDKLISEDFPKVPKVLEKFFELVTKNKIVGSNADIYTYPDLPSLTNAIRPFMDASDTLNMTNAEYEQISKDFIASVGNFNLYIPSSYENSVILGRDSSWCTAYPSSSYNYNNYTARGELYIFINMNDSQREKYQIHFQDGYYANINDSNIGKSNFKQKFPELYNVAIDTLAKRGKFMTDNIMDLVFGEKGIKLDKDIEDVKSIVSLTEESGINLMSYVSNRGFKFKDISSLLDFTEYSINKFGDDVLKNNYENIINLAIGIDIREHDSKLENMKTVCRRYDLYGVEIKDERVAENIGSIADAETLQMVMDNFEIEFGYDVYIKIAENENYDVIVKKMNNDILEYGGNLLINDDDDILNFYYTCLKNYNEVYKEPFLNILNAKHSYGYILTPIWYYLIVNKIISDKELRKKHYEPDMYIYHDEKGFYIEDDLKSIGELVVKESSDTVSVSTIVELMEGEIDWDYPVDSSSINDIIRYNFSDETYNYVYKIMKDHVLEQDYENYSEGQKLTLKVLKQMDDDDLAEIIENESEFDELSSAITTALSDCYRFAEEDYFYKELINAIKNGLGEIEFIDGHDKVRVYIGDVLINAIDSLDNLNTDFDEYFREEFMYDSKEYIYGDRYGYSGDFSNEDYRETLMSLI